MMLRINFGSIVRVGQKPKGLFITIVVNWLVKPFSMALLGSGAALATVVGMLVEVPVMLSLRAICAIDQPRSSSSRRITAPKR